MPLSCEKYTCPFPIPPKTHHIRALDLNSSVSRSALGLDFDEASWVQVQFLWRTENQKHWLLALSVIHETETGQQRLLFKEQKNREHIAVSAPWQFWNQAVTCFQKPPIPSDRECSLNRIQFWPALMDC